MRPRIPRPCRRFIFLAAGGLLLPALAAAPAAAAPHTEVIMDHRSRPAPPQVPAIVIDGLSYAQVLNARRLGLSGPCGWLVATDAKTGERKWTQQIYTTVIDPADETDVQEVYFQSMTRIKGRRALEIRNEAGRVFVIDLDIRAVSEVVP